ncbi:DUF3592 domain-containing protein [Streptomyces olivaceus]|uniref:DUF3592 domain-containing protein n=1 Tax=Streptomyces olivaceus TaxID=47716 RepID=A0ABS7VWW6_STROV|nr:DUF3592 domain-containing protein [Streptomyces olivaceus]MBZ6087360.1 DUF3592 domain-containing protein [Streptomyces olivaceus]MBZ6115155.1 DUF3592 domain-containing protein [Streptomyces olivaceus]MBZ6150204.1 DUF3592 domain-containing protein [Streptomyces olivaceus]MBZ6192760.1 DUF3592 domain-containing protein [Streptomyces olivaceus]MBZ6296788.1 DUF3592 domain-containing protein [Streptomyces olivaceus]
MGALVCSVVGGLLLWAGLYDAARVRRLRRHGIRTTGRVVDNVRVQEPRSSSPSWAPVIAFADQHGYRVEFTPSMRGAGMGLPTGREVDVVYLPHNPQVARVFTRRHMTGPVLFIMAMGLLFLGLGVVIGVTG